MKILGIQTRINQNGRIVIPAVIRNGMGLKLGDNVVMSLDDDVLRIEPLRAKVRRAQDGSRKIGEPVMQTSVHPAQERREDPLTEKDDWLG